MQHASSDQHAHTICSLHLKQNVHKRSVVEITDVYVSLFRLELICFKTKWPELNQVEKR